MCIRDRLLSDLLANLLVRRSLRRDDARSLIGIGNERPVLRALGRGTDGLGALRNLGVTERVLRGLGLAGLNLRRLTVVRVHDLHIDLTDLLGVFTFTLGDDDLGILRLGALRNRDLDLASLLVDLDLGARDLIVALIDELAGLITSRVLDLADGVLATVCLLYTSPSPRDATLSRMPSSA